MAAIKDAQALLEKLRAAYGKGDYAGAKGAFDQLKVRGRGRERGARVERREREPLFAFRGLAYDSHARTLEQPPTCIPTQQQVKLIQLPALPPTFERTPTAQQELLIGRECCRPPRGTKRAPTRRRRVLRRTLSPPHPPHTS